MGSRAFRVGDLVMLNDGWGTVDTVWKVTKTGIVHLRTSPVSFAADGWGDWGITIRHATRAERTKHERGELIEKISTKVHRLPLAKLRAIAEIIGGGK